MEHISNHLNAQVPQTTQPPLSPAPKQSLILTPEEKRIQEVKGASRPFAVMLPKELSMSANALVIKIHVITGWAIPGEELQRVLKDQLQKHLLEAYRGINAEEVEYAFRAYGSAVKDWGKSMNLALFDEVMAPYLKKRRELMKLEEQQRPQIEAPKENLTDKTMQEWLDDTAEKVSKGLRVDFIPVMLYDWLLKCGKVVSHETKLLDAATLVKNRILGNALDREGRRIYRSFSEMWNKGEFSAPFDKEIETLAKKMIVWDYINENAKSQQ